MNKKWFAVLTAIAVLTIGAERAAWAHAPTNRVTEKTYNHTHNTVAEAKTAVTTHNQ
jgi:hypothetical protein